MKRFEVTINEWNQEPDKKEDGKTQISFELCVREIEAASLNEDIIFYAESIASLEERLECMNKEVMERFENFMRWIANADFDDAKAVVDRMKSEQNEFDSEISTIDEWMMTPYFADIVYEDNRYMMTIAGLENLRVYGETLASVRDAAVVEKEQYLRHKLRASEEIPYPKTMLI
jgi:Zn-dependent M16 (insulinase) family peptidase